MNIVGSILTPSARYTEAPDSGIISDEIASGVRTRKVTAIYTCFKSEVREILGQLEVRPAPLLTAGGRDATGAVASYVNWGNDFELKGANVAEISPHLSKISADYEATDPTGGAAVAGSGNAGGGIIGRFLEGGQIFAETPASGKMREDRIYLADSFGWNRTRMVERQIVCMRSDTRTVCDGLSLAPSALITNAGSGPTVNWGGSYSLVSIYGAPISPSFYGITAKYRRNIAEAIAAPPAGVAIGCIGGVCYIDWQSTRFESLASGTSDTTGMDVDNPSGYTIRLLCNNIPFDVFTPSISSGDKILEWSLSGNKAQLLWCGEVWKEYNI